MNAEHRAAIQPSLRYPDAWAIGMLRLPHIEIPMPISQRDAQRDSAWAAAVLDELGLVAGRPVHLIGNGADALGVWPLENALIARGLPSSCAEGAGWDAPRTEMFVRRFQPQAVLGLTEGVIDALAATHDLRKLFGYGPTLLGSPTAAQKLAALDLPCRHMFMLGPALAVESRPTEGLRYDTSEWRVEEEAGELLLTSLAPRAWPMVRLRLGLRGSVRMQDSKRRAEPRVHLA